jgi:uncharacterized protein (DUF1810 family)
MNTEDPFDLQRFVDAQRDDFADALAEIRRGRKESHWMWYIFPQFRGLGLSPLSQQYAIQSREEAEAYLQHEILGSRLKECAAATLHIEGKSAHDVFGSPDDLKLKSCCTLFAAVSPAGSVFELLLDKYYQGEHDPKTLQLLGEASN